MRRLSLVAIGGGLFVLAIIANFTFFVVKETEQALVLQFGNPLDVIDEPGLHMKWPFVQNAQYFEKRLLTYDPQPAEVILGDTKRLLVSTTIIYSIADPLQFYTRVGDERGAQLQLNQLMDSIVRNVLAEERQATVLSSERVRLMREIQERMRSETERLGIDLIDVRILRAELPEQNTARVLTQMQTEREQEARLARSEGEQAATEMRADADLEEAELVAGAQRQSQQIRGEADNYGLSTLASAYAQDEEFFRFYYRLTRYPDALNGANTTIYMGADSHFLQLLSGQDFDLGEAIQALETGPGSPLPEAAVGDGEATDDAVVEGVAPEDPVTDGEPEPDGPEIDTIEPEE